MAWTINTARKLQQKFPLVATALNLGRHRL